MFNTTFRGLRFFAIPALLLCFFSTALVAQMPGGGAPGGGGNFDPSKLNIGRFYGKVVDENGKGVGYATVKLMGKKFDPQSKKMTEGLISGQLTQENGDFSLEKLPVMGEFNLEISFIGFATITQKVSFGLAAPGGAKPGASAPPSGAPGSGNPMAGAMAGNFDKDLGNIPLKPDTKTLQEVVINAEAPTATLALDKKIYRVDKDASAVGGNAQDALKNVPSLSVDIDGNVSLRNGAPQIFVDGRPTTLTLDQIPAAAIETVEVITNPSAKYDAGGGTAGIVNIVLKKERRLGYNGNVRTGVDTRQGFNFGGDVNARGEKVNLFVSGNLNRMRAINEGETARQNFFGSPETNVFQNTDGKMQGYFANARAGLDWLMDNRNTLTFSGNLTRGSFHPSDLISTRTDSLFSDRVGLLRYTREGNTARNFRNLGLSVQFKHLFPKQGAEWTADVNYNNVKFEGSSDFNTLYESGNNIQEKQEGTGDGAFITIQTDLVYPLKSNWKVETGLRAAMRDNENQNGNFRYSTPAQEWQRISNLTDNFRLSDDVYAAYGTLSKQQGRWGYQAGLRLESSFYQGELTDRDSSFRIVYPAALFPSGFVTYKISETSNLQLSYTRRVNRPNFFQTMPFVDFTDSLNLRRGNPQLRPEFTNALELSWQKTFKGGHDILSSLYYKNATNLLTTYLSSEYNETLQKEVIVSTYINANQSHAAGAEFTLKNTLFKLITLTTNINAFYTQVDADNVEANLTIDRWSAFFKEILQVRLPQNWTLQLNGEYRTRVSFLPSNNNDPFRGGPHGGSQNSAQGYSIANWYVDASVRKDFWKKQGSLTLSAGDIFASRKNGSYSSSELFIQDSWMIRNPQIVRLNFSYRFGKMDASLFKRKNNKVNMQGNDMMGG